jgi:hypothetical protein
MCIRGREPEGVLDQVREHPLHLSAVDVDERGFADDVDTLACVERLDCFAGEIVERPELGLGRRAACLEARQVQQVAHEAAQAVRVELDRLEQLAAVGLAQMQRRVPERADGRTDAGERRTQVMRDRTEQRGLDEVAPPQGLGLERLALEPRAVDRHGQERRQRRQKAMLDGDARVRALRRVERPDRPPVDGERERRGARRRPMCLAEHDLGAPRAEDVGRARADLADLHLEIPPAEEICR